MSRYGDAENLTNEQKNQLIEWLMYRLKVEPRKQLMAALPQVYNAYYGREIVSVHHFSQGKLES